VAHPVEDHELGARDRVGGRPATAHVHERIIGTVEDERGFVGPRRLAVVSPESMIARRLAGDAEPIVGAVIGKSRPLTQVRLL
jgi:hypothetical protein